MKRHERTRILIEGDQDILQRIAMDVEENFSISTLDDPQECLVLVKVRESAQRSLFYLGEALMTTCRVNVEGVQGTGMVLGSDRSRAYALALADAAFSLEDARFDERAWESLLTAEAKKLEEEAAKKRSRTAATRVDFSTMEVAL